MPGKETTTKGAAKSAPKEATTEEAVKAAVVGTDAGDKDVNAPDPKNAIVDQAQIQDIEEATGAAIQDKANPPAKAKDEAPADGKVNPPAAEAPKAETKKAAVAEAEAAKPKTVSIVMVQDHKPSIGGQEYDFKKHQTYEVSEDVAAILTNAFVAMRK